MCLNARIDSAEPLQAVSISDDRAGCRDLTAASGVLVVSSNPPLVSVIISTYNYGLYVCDAVESALSQTYSMVEVIVVDDGSTDDTRERLAPYTDRIKYIYQNNAGVSAARNTGMRVAQGEYLAFLDADDRFHPQKLEFQMALFARDRKLGLVGTGHTTRVPVIWETSVGSQFETDYFTLEDMVIQPRFGTSTVVLRKECIESVGSFDPALSRVEDYDLWIRIAAKYRIAVIPLRLMWYRLSPGSLSRNAAAMERYHRLVIERAFEMPELVDRWVLRRKALGMANLGSCYDYRDAGQPIQAIKRLVRSLWWWPLPYRGSEVRASLIRVRMFLATVRMMLFGSRTDH